MTTAHHAPAPIDARMPRFNQAVLAVALLGGFVFNLVWVIPVWAVVLALGAAFGPQYGPFLRLYTVALAPRLAPPTVMEDPRPPRFAALIGAGFLTLATLFLLSGVAALAWVFALIVAALAALAAGTGLCIGCEAYLILHRRRGQ